MPHCPELTWEQVKLQGRERYFATVNAGLRACFYERWLRFHALTKVCKHERDVPQVIAADFPDCWSRPSRWYYDHLLAEKRLAARDWLNGVTHER